MNTKKAGFLSVGYSRFVRYYGLITMILGIYNTYLLKGFEQVSWWHAVIALPVILVLGRLFMRFEVHGLWRAEREADFSTHPSKREFELIRQELKEIKDKLNG